MWRTCHVLVAAATAQCRFFWISISSEFKPEELPLVDGRTGSVTHTEVQSLDYEIISSGRFTRKTSHFKKTVPPKESHPSLIFVRVWEHSSVSGQREKRMRPSVLAKPCIWKAAVPNLEAINPKLYSWLITPQAAPMR